MLYHNFQAHIHIFDSLTVLQSHKKIPFIHLNKALLLSELFHAAFFENFPEKARKLFPQMKANGCKAIHRPNNELLPESFHRLSVLP